MNSKILSRITLVTCLVLAMGASGLQAQTYTLSNGFGGEASEGFTASYCRSEGRCATIKGAYLKVRVEGSGVGTAELKGTTFEGAPVRVEAPLRVLPQEKGMRCG